MRSYLLLIAFGMLVGQAAPQETKKAEKKEERRLREEWGFKPLHTIETDVKTISSLAFSPDSKTLAWADCDGKIRFWDVATRKMRTTVLTHSHPEGAISSTAIAFSPDGKLLASTRQARNGGLILWDLNSGKEIAQLPTSWHTSAPQFDSKGRMLAVMDITHVIAFDVAKKVVLHRFDYKDGGGSELFVAISPDGKKLVHNGASSPRLHVWDCVKSEKERVISTSGLIRAVHWSKDGKTLVAVGPASHGYCEVSYWHADKGTHYKRLQMAMHGKDGVSYDATGLVFSPGEKYLAMGDYYRDQHRLEIWNTTNGKSVAFNCCWLPASSSDLKLFACCRFVGETPRVEILEFKELQKLLD